ncbi:MAG: hypothetical protein M1818_002370 [Claussenomyces sp. TS43310]|nr:MAG: hypothetical protein M1818_002370 [Claussenomyces sp. TS43310]
MTHIVRLPRIDDNASFVLINVSSSGRQGLDVKLVGTEGSAPYATEGKLVCIGDSEKFSLIKTQVKHSRINTLRSKNSLCTGVEWAAILESTLLGKVRDDASDISNVEAVAAVAENESITITIRRRIEGITQRLGTLSLSYDESQEIELFDWCGIAVKDQGTSTHEFTSMKSKYRELEQTNRRLQSQLDELIVAKKEHETELLEKFRDLLNAKKAKIRDQQLLLACANVDPEKLARVQAIRQSKTRVASTSAAGKRKAGVAEDIEEESEDEEGFEKMDVDVDEVPDDSDQGRAITPDQGEDDEEEDDETTGEDEASQLDKPPAKSARQAAQTNPNHHPGADKKGKSSSTTSKVTPAEMEKEKTPPRRELPFLKKSAPAPVKPVPADDGDETASEDDEL